MNCHDCLFYCAPDERHTKWYCRLKDEPMTRRDSKKENQCEWAINKIAYLDAMIKHYWES